MDTDNEELENSISDHTSVAKPDQLIGPQVVDMIINKPGTYDETHLKCVV